MRYLTAQHEVPPSVIEHEGVNYPVSRLIELGDSATLALLGIFPHVYLDPSIPAPLGTEWAYNDTEAQWEQVPLGTEAERRAYQLKQAWQAEKQARQQKQAERALNAPATNTPEDTQRRIDALNTLRSNF